VAVAAAAGAAAAASSARMMSIAAAASAAALATNSGSNPLFSSYSAAATSREPRGALLGTVRLRWRKATLARGGMVAGVLARGRAPAGLGAALTRPASATLDTREAMSGGGALACVAPRA